MSLDYSSIFLLSPLVFLYVGVQMVVPPLSALLPDATGQSLRDIAPIFGPELRDIFREFFIFLLAPRALDHGRV